MRYNNYKSDLEKFPYLFQLYYANGAKMYLVVMRLKKDVCDLEIDALVSVQIL